jgi:hypothetical protein
VYKENGSHYAWTWKISGNVIQSLQCLPVAPNASDKCVEAIIVCFMLLSLSERNYCYLLCKFDGYTGQCHSAALFENFQRKIKTMYD